MKIVLEFLYAMCAFVVHTPSRPVRISVKREQNQKPLSAALLALPDLAQVLVQAGVKEIAFKPGNDGRLSHAEWLFHGRLANEDLLQARQRALEILSQAGVKVAEPAVKEVELGDSSLADIIRQAGQGGDKSRRSGGAFA
ncbi:MAG: hypothetical protein KatS3mg023_3675 [Armatimonadota bacterium]|nr:MAG: hypothetical protein KatS3mg023_3675 [Armatimonadota bacterium]